MPPPLIRFSWFRVIFLFQVLRQRHPYRWRLPLSTSLTELFLCLLFLKNNQLRIILCEGGIFWGGVFCSPLISGKIWKCNQCHTKIFLFICLRVANMISDDRGFLPCIFSFKPILLELYFPTAVKFFSYHTNTSPRNRGIILITIIKIFIV